MSLRGKCFCSLISLLNTIRMSMISRVIFGDHHSVATRGRKPLRCTTTWTEFLFYIYLWDNWRNNNNNNDTTVWNDNNYMSVYTWGTIFFCNFGVCVHWVFFVVSEKRAIPKSKQCVKFYFKLEKRQKKLLKCSLDYELWVFGL